MSRILSQFKISNIKKSSLSSLIQKIESTKVKHFSCSSVKNSSEDDNNDSKKDTNRLGHTTILVQQGCDIQELPVIVRKIGQNDIIALLSNCTPPPAILSNISKPDENLEGTVLISTTTSPTGPSQITPEVVLKNIDSCLTTNGVYSIINSIPVDDFVPAFAEQALNKILRIETLENLYNLEKNSTFDALIHCLVTRADNQMLLKILDLLKNYLDLIRSVDRICDELLLRNSDNKLTIEDAYGAINNFVECKRQKSAEKFWTSLSENSRMITQENIKHVYGILPKLKISRRTVLNILERQIMNVWWQINSDTVIDVLASLEQCKNTPYRTMQSLSRWLHTNIHTLDESHLESIIESFTKLDYSDQQIEKSIERYIKAKGVKVKSQSLIVTILQHCQHFRYRNVHILNGCSEYFISNYTKIDPGYARAVLAPFGILDFQPLNCIKFWQILEKYLDMNFQKIVPSDMISIMLTCVYLEKCPFNFIKRIFNPYFLDVLHKTTKPELIPKIRTDLKLFDTSLTLECKDYDGPLLPRDNMAQSIWQDGRIKRIINQIPYQLSDVAGGNDRYTKSVVLQQLPINELYIIDVLLHPSGMNNIWNFNIRRERNIHAALLIHLPEHYNSTGEFLVGPQMMRIRHLRQLGLKVVTLRYDTLVKLKMHPKELKSYLVEEMRKAQTALPPIK